MKKKRLELELDIIKYMFGHITLIPRYDAKHEIIHLQIIECTIQE